MLTVSGQLFEKTQLQLFDIRGRLVLTTELEANQAVHTINVASLEDGVYIVELDNSSQAKTQKVIIR